ncbi:conserved hypothetical protein [Treponema primitia ZAS-2]|uniref:Uncharacterized protein n=1 Tax=Treponema primitia (strain ATCC BAA-887 / DSM 12427 / ZAS-2) TaxID=545694 RepID=F5YKK6_TREPZ|nr:hypothetical protein [Treponema primitia]AEF85142.1 conserved hypothetical protein [Treponema primitia ZAS-2]
MKITIDGKPADIILEKEKTLGDLLGGIGEWLSGSRYSLSGLRINGETTGAASLEAAFDRDLGELETLDIETSSLPQLLAEALLDIQNKIAAYENASFEERRNIQQNWETGPSASFLAEQIPDIYGYAAQTFRGEGFAPESLSSLIEERLRELRDPGAELGRIEQAVESIATRLEDLPLDIQTGKDGRAAETVQLFSGITEKIFRLLSFLKLEGFVTDTLVIDTARETPLQVARGTSLQVARGTSLQVARETPLQVARETPLQVAPFSAFIEDFSAALKELLAAYEVKDAVLVGDLAEYEVAPRLRALYSAIKTPAAAAS